MENEKYVPIEDRLLEVRKKMLKQISAIVPGVIAFCESLMDEGYLKEKKAQHVKYAREREHESFNERGDNAMIKHHEARLKMAEAEVEFEKKHGRAPFPKKTVYVAPQTPDLLPQNDYDPHAHLAETRVQRKRALGPWGHLDARNTAFGKAFDELLAKQKKGEFNQPNQQDEKESNDQKAKGAQKETGNFKNKTLKTKGQKSRGNAGRGR